MIKTLIKTNILLVLLVLGLGFSGGANAEAIYGTPPPCPYGDSYLPGPYDVYVSTGTNFTGTCYWLRYTYNDLWNSWDVSTGFPNDQIQSVWVGSNITLVLFWNSLGTGDNGVPLHFGPGQYSGNLGSWNRKASAARIQLFPFGQCLGTMFLPGSTLPAVTLSLYTDQNFSSANDCTMLSHRYYNNPVEMGFRNDSMTSFVNGSPYNAYFDSNSSSIGCFFGSCGAQYQMTAYTSSTNVGSSFNDSLSAIAW